MIRRVHILVLTCLTVFPGHATADELIEGLGRMSVTAANCLPLVPDKVELFDAMGLTMAELDNWKASATEEQIASFEFGVAQQTQREVDKPVEEMTCVFSGLFYVGFATALKISNK